MKKVGIVAGVILTALLMLAVYMLDLPGWKKLDTDRIVHTDAASVMLDKNGSEVMLLMGNGAPVLLSASEIPNTVKKAFVAAEDRNFYAHRGIDVKRIFGALASDIRHMRFAEGASTITQQLIKLTHLSPEKTVSRKANEAYLALCLENQWSKDEILTAYLNQAYFGEGAYGIERAALTYFGVSAKELDLPQAAMLAGILKAPSSMNPFSDAEKARTRRAYVLSSMFELGFITEEEKRNATEAPIPERVTLAQNDSAFWYRDRVLSEASDALGISVDELLSGGYTVYTCFDPNVQAEASALFKDKSLFPSDAKDGTPVQAAFCALDAENGEIRALIGGRTYDVQRGLNRATDARRQPGSTIKPVSVYAAAIDAMGMSPSSLLDDSPREFAGGYAPSNAGEQYYGLVTLRTALAKSLNVASVNLLEFTGIGLARQYAMNAGLPLDASDNGLSLALGSLTYGVTPLELACAYAPLSNGGKAVKGHTVRKITDREGKTVYEFTPSAHTVMSAQSAYLITSMLVTAAEEGSAKALSSAGMPVAAKTGTVSCAGGNRDIWTCAYTTDMVACVWMGFDQTDDAHVLPASAGGSGYPARMLARFFQNASEGKAFSMPDGIIQVKLDRLALQNRYRLLLASNDAPKSMTLDEVFKEGSEPKYYSDTFDAPPVPKDFSVKMTENGSVEICVKIEDENADYIVMRRDEQGQTVCGTLSGKKGEEKYLTDKMPYDDAEYSVLARNRLLYENGITIVSAESEPIRVKKKSLLLMTIERLFGRE